MSDQLTQTSSSNQLLSPKKSASPSANQNLAFSQNINNPMKKELYSERSKNEASPFNMGNNNNNNQARLSNSASPKKELIPTH